MTFGILALGFPVSEVLEVLQPLGAHSLTFFPILPYLNAFLRSKPPKQGTPGPGCQTSPKECIKIGKNREESETVSPQRLQNPPKPPKQGTPGPGCQTSPKECIKIGKNREESETVSPQRLQNLQNLRNREPQGQDAKRHLRNALR